MLVTPTSPITALAEALRTRIEDSGGADRSPFQVAPLENRSVIETYFEVCAHCPNAPVGVCGKLPQLLQSALSSTKTNAAVTPPCWPEN